MAPVLRPVGHFVENLVRHQGGHGPPDLVVARVASHRPQQQEEEPRRHRDLGQVPQDHGGVQPHERRHRLLEEVDLPDEDVAGFRARGDLPHEVEVVLVDVSVQVQVARALISADRVAAGAFGEAVRLFGACGHSGGVSCWGG